MPAATKKDLRLARSIKELNLLANDIPKLTDARKFLKTAEQVFKKADELNLDGDEESAYVMYMRYFNIISAIKKSSEYRKNEKYYKEMIGSKRSERAILEAERLSTSLKDRYDEREAEEVSKKMEALHIKRDKEMEREETPDKKVEPAKKDAKSKGEGKGDTTPSTDNSEKDVQNGQPKKSPSITVQELYAILKHSKESIVIMDVRPPDQFAESRINHKNCINVPSEILPPGSTVNYIERALPEESRSLWQQRASMEHIVMLDWRCNLGSLTTRTTLASLKDALWKWDAYTILKSEPVVLDGGYDEWLTYYPTLSTNANVTRPRPTEGPSVEYSLDNITYELDQAFLDSPEKDDKSSSKDDELDMSEETGTTTRTAPVPSIDRSLKPSANLNNSKAAPSKSAPSLSVQNGKLANLDMIKNQLKKDLLEDDTSNKNTLRSNEPEEKVRDSVPFRTASPSSVPPTLRPKVNNVPSVNRNLKPKLDSAEGSALARAEYEAAQRARKDYELSYDEHKRETRHLVEERRARIASLELEERKLEAVEKLKRKELAETADVMRLKRRIQSEIAGLEADRERAEAEGQTRKEELQKLLDEEAQKLRIRQEAERLRALKKRPHTEGGQEESREHSPVHQQQEPTVEEDQNALLEAERREQEKREYERREHERRERERREQERRREEFADQERKHQMDRAAAREMKQEQERLAEIKRLEKEKRDKEWMERENKKAAQREAGGTPVSWQKSRDPITGAYTPVSSPVPPGSPQRQATPTSRGATPTARTPGFHTPGNPGLYKTRLRDEDDLPRSGGMRRSHSSPNIAQMMQDEDQTPEPLRPAVVNVDRTRKPRTPRPELQPVPAKTEVSAAKVRNLQPTWGNVGRGLTGLRNLGNTCYMNSTIQCLSNTSFLTTYFLTDNHRMDINRENVMGKKGEVAEEFAVLIKALWTGQYRYINPRDFKGVISKHHSVFAGYDQQDSQEMLLFLLDSLHEDLNKVRKRPKITDQENDGLPERVAAEKAWSLHKRINDSIIVDLFQGQFISTVTCTKCEKSSTTFDTFMYLTVPIPSNSRCTLRDCILHFAKEEKMTGDSQWFCPRCKCRRDARKHISIYRLPRILLIHLKRFYYQGMWRQKINASVDFPLEGLDLNHYIHGPEKQNPYHLYAVSNHYGTMEGGHYTAFCRSPSNSRWYKFDDHEVYDISRSDIKTSAAYILYYTSIQQDMKFAS